MRVVGSLLKRLGKFTNVARQGAWMLCEPWLMFQISAIITRRCRKPETRNSCCLPACCYHAAHIATRRRSSERSRYEYLHVLI